jgi:glycosyltransferase involved in cell wall biosynthesis
MEIVVVDDASEDDTPDMLQELSAEGTVTLVRNKSPRGAAASRNIAIDHAKGEYIAGLDDDDFWRPRRIELLMDAFEEGFSAVCSNDRMVFDDKEIVWKKKPVITLNDLLYYNQAGNQVLTKKDYLTEVGGYDEALPSAQDYDLWIRLAHDFGPIKTVPHTLQVVNMESDRERISTSGDETHGYYACYEKHKSRMNEDQIKYQLYRMKLAEGEKAGWVEMFRSVPGELLVKEITRKLFL